MCFKYKDGCFIYSNFLTDSLFMYDLKTGFCRYDNMSERQLKKVFREMKKMKMLFSNSIMKMIIY